MKDERAIEPGTQAPLMATDKLEGTAIYDLQGKSVAVLDDLLIDASNGEVCYLLVARHDGEQSERLLPIPWEALTFDDGKNGYVVAAPAEALDNAPSIARGQVVDWTDQSWGARLRSHYMPEGGTGEANRETGRKQEE